MAREKGQSATDSLNDRSILPEGKVMGTATSRTHHVIYDEWWLPFILFTEI